MPIWKQISRRVAQTRAVRHGQTAESAISTYAVHAMGVKYVATGSIPRNISHSAPAECGNREPASERKGAFAAAQELEHEIVTVAAVIDDAELHHAPEV